jgi:hypothetical protein
MPDSPKDPPRSFRMQSVSAIFGLVDKAPKRPVLFGRYTIPRLCFDARMQWLAKVQRLLAQCSQNRERYPHKVFQVASVLAHIGDECRLSRERIAERAGCVVRTVGACISWLEERGVLTWTHTAQRHETRRVVRSNNLYSLILDFTGLRAVITRARRAIWRERRKDVSTGNECPGVTQLINITDRFEDRRALAEFSRARTKQLNQDWENRPSAVRLRETLSKIGLRSAQESDALPSGAS